MSISNTENVANSEPTLSPADKAKLQQNFAHGNKQMAVGGHDYANLMFLPCVLGDPSNVIYLKTFLANLKKKYGEKKKKGALSFLSGKKTVNAKKAGQSFKSAVEALQANPWDVGALLAAGGSCEELGYHDVAIEYYRAAVEAEPLDVDANWICCKALREIADYDGAMVCVARILKVKPTDQAAIKMRNDLTVEKTIHKSKIATGDMAQVRGAASGEPLIAEDQDAMGRQLSYVEQIERRIKKNPNDLANYLELAQHYYQQAEYDKAENAYLQVVKLTDKAPDMVERLLDTQKQKFHTLVVALKDEFAATKDAARREAIKPEFERAKEDFERKNIELAQHRIKLHPSHTGYRFEYGTLLLQKNLVKEAIGEFQLAKPDQSRAGECNLALGQCFQKIKQYKLAMTHYQDAVAILSPGDDKKKALYLATKLAYALEDYEKAEQYGLQLAAIDFSYKDLGELLDKVAQKRHN